MPGLRESSYGSRRYVFVVSAIQNLFSVNIPRDFCIEVQLWIVAAYRNGVFMYSRYTRINSGKF